MQINSIKTDGNGYKLIAAQKVYNQPKNKPFKCNTHLFDFKDNVLRQFNANSFKEVFCTSYKAALKYILSL